MLVNNTHFRLGSLGHDFVLQEWECSRFPLPLPQVTQRERKHNFLIIHRCICWHRAFSSSSVCLFGRKEGINTQCPWLLSTDVFSFPLLWPALWLSLSGRCRGRGQVFWLGCSPCFLHVCFTWAGDSDCLRQRGSDACGVSATVKGMKQAAHLSWHWNFSPWNHIRKAVSVGLKGAGALCTWSHPSSKVRWRNVMLIWNLRGTDYFALRLALFVVFLSIITVFPVWQGLSNWLLSDSGVTACQSGCRKQWVGPFVTPGVWREAAQALGFDEISERCRV